MKDSTPPALVAGGALLVVLGILVFFWPIVLHVVSTMMASQQQGIGAVAGGTTRVQGLIASALFVTGVALFLVGAVGLGYVALRSRR